jgi:chemotaxis protein MotB
MAKKKRVEKDNAERYLVPYADLLTLMLAFFVVLYAMSSVDEKKMETLGDSFASAFNVTPISQPAGFEKQIHPREHRQPVSDQEINQMRSVSEQNSLRELKKQIDEKIKEEHLESDVSTNLNETGLRIVLTNKVLFETASATLTNTHSIKLIGDIGVILKGVENPISIEGHTDNIPIKTEEFDSNWELSSSRALSILREMTKSYNGLNPGNFSATGYAEFRPLVENVTVEDRTRNRRVEIVIKRISGDDLLTPEKGGENK